MVYQEWLFGDGATLTEEASNSELLTIVAKHLSQGLEMACKRSKSEERTFYKKVLNSLSSELKNFQDSEDVEGLANKMRGALLELSSSDYKSPSLPNSVSINTFHDWYWENNKKGSAGSKEGAARVEFIANFYLKRLTRLLDF